MSDYMDRLMKKAEAFVWDEGPEAVDPVKENAVQSDDFDKISYEVLSETVPALEKSIKEVANEHDYVAPAYEDLFNLLHGGDPEFEDKRAMKEGYDANHEMLSGMADTSEFAELRKETAFDEYATAFTMLSMEDDMKEAFKHTKEARERRAAAQEAFNQAQQAIREAMQNAQNGQDPAGQGLATAIEEAGAAQENLAAATEAQQQATKESAQKLAGAAAAAGEELSEQEAQASAYGTSPGELKRKTFEERQALTAQLNHGKMKALADLVGQWREYGTVARNKKVVTQPDEVYDVELGNDLDKILASEFNNLALPEMEDLFFLGYANHSLMQWKKRGPKALGKGPILLVCDESGSMDQPVDSQGNTREMWSKAIGMALADQARKGKRDFTYIGFSSAYEQWQLDFPGGETPFEKVKEFVTHFFGGGTNYEIPMAQALALCQAAADEGRNLPDIVFVTDDDCRVSTQFVETWREARDRLGITVYGIQIGGASLRTTMPELCDKTIDLSAVNSDPEGMTELFRTI